MAPSGNSSTTYCSIHKVRHGAAACPVCRHLDRVTTAPRVSREWWLVIASSGAALAVALVWWLWLKPGLLGPIDPEGCRTQMREVERRLYRPAPAPEGERVRLELAVGKLATSVQRSWVPLGATGRFLRALRAFEARVGAQGEAAFQAPDLLALRADWEALRTGHLRAAAWFSSSSPELDEAQLWFDKYISIADAQQYESTLVALEDVIAKAAGILDGVPEFIDSSSDHPDLCKGWGRWGADSRRDIEAVRRNLPAVPTGAGRHWLQVHSTLQDALRVAAGLLKDNQGNLCGVPSRSEGQRRVESAHQAVRLVRLAITAAQAEDKVGGGD